MERRGRRGGRLSGGGAGIGAVAGDVSTTRVVSTVVASWGGRVALYSSYVQENNILNCLYRCTAFNSRRQAKLAAGVLADASSARAPSVRNTHVADACKQGREKLD